MKPADGARLIYLHGFRSSSRSFKAQLLARRCDDTGNADRFVCPDLPPAPAQAIAMVRDLVRPTGADTLVGSSLGGFYATWLAEQYDCRAVLINPVVDAAGALQRHVGAQTGWHDGAPFEFRSEYLAQLRRLAVPAVLRPVRYWLIAATGDEVLDWREMVHHYAGARQTIVHGADHALSGFAAYVDDVLAFAGMPPR